MPPSGGALTRLWSAAHIWREKSNFKFAIYLYLCRNFIVFVLNLVYLYIKLPSVALFLKFSKFVTTFVTILHLRSILFYVDL